MEFLFEYGFPSFEYMILFLRGAPNFQTYSPLTMFRYEYYI